MKYLHTMVRVTNLEESLAFYGTSLGLIEVARQDIPASTFKWLNVGAGKRDTCMSLESKNS